MNLEDYYKVNTIKDAAGILLGTNLDTSSIIKITDCVKNLDDIILDRITNAIINKVLENDSVSAILGTIDSAISLANQGKALLDLVKDLSTDDLLSSLVSLRTLKANGIDVVDKVSFIKEKFGPYVTNINDLVDNIANIDICKVPNVRPTGATVGSLSKMPFGEPQAIQIPEETILKDDTSINAKNSYDDLMFRFTSGLGKDQTPAGDDYKNAISVLMTVAYAYHDKISRSVDSSKDSTYLDEYNTSIKSEHTRSSWIPDCKILFMSRANIVGSILNKDAQVIRDYYARNSTPSGTLISTGVTVYSGPEYDFTTFLDLKESERPPELVAKWSAKYNIPEQEAKLRARGIKPQTLTYADAFNGAYGKIVSDATVASTRLPGDSKILLKNPDGSIYNPSGKNPSGIYTVKDTGNTKLTYNKFDIFALDPTPYVKSNMAGVQVFLISKGNQLSAKYTNAQKLYGNA